MNMNCCPWAKCGKKGTNNCVIFLWLCTSQLSRLGSHNCIITCCGGYMRMQGTGCNHYSHSPFACNAAMEASTWERVHHIQKVCKSERVYTRTGLRKNEVQTKNGCQSLFATGLIRELGTSKKTNAKWGFLFALCLHQILINIACLYFRTVLYLKFFRICVASQNGNRINQWGRSSSRARPERVTVRNCRDGQRTAVAYTGNY